MTQLTHYPAGVDETAQQEQILYRAISSVVLQLITNIQLCSEVSDN